MANTTLFVDGAENYAATNNAVLDDIMQDGPWAAASGINLTTDKATDTYAFKATGPTSYMRRSLKGDYTRLRLLLTQKMEALPIRTNTQFAVAQIRNIYNNPIVSVLLTPSGRVRITDYQGNQLAISTLEVAAGQHNHFEILLQPSKIQVRVNNKSAFTVSYSGTLNSLNEGGTPGNNAAALVHFGAISSSQLIAHTGYVIYDDIAALTFTSGDDDTYIGPYGVYYQALTANGFYAQWDYSAGSSGPALLNDVPPDGDATYIYTDTTGEKASYTVSPLPTNVTAVQSVTPVVYARKTDSGPGSITLGTRLSGTDGMAGDDDPLTTDYGYLSRSFDERPGGGAWSTTSLPEIIVERTT